HAAEDDDILYPLRNDGGTADPARRPLPRRWKAIHHGIEVVIHGGAAPAETRGILAPASLAMRTVWTNATGSVGPSLRLAPGCVKASCGPGEGRRRPVS